MGFNYFTGSGPLMWLFVLTFTSVILVVKCFSVSVSFFTVFSFQFLQIFPFHFQFLVFFSFRFSFS